MTDKVSTAPGDVERLAKALEWKVDKDACANSNSHADYIEWQAAATLRALSAEVERLKVERVHLAEFAWKHIGEDLMAMTPQEAVDAFDKSRAALGE